MRIVITNELTQYKPNDHASKASTYVYNGSANIAQNRMTDRSFVMPNSPAYRLNAFIIISSEATV